VVCGWWEPTGGVGTLRSPLRAADFWNRGTRRSFGKATRRVSTSGIAKSKSWGTSNSCRRPVSWSLVFRSRSRARPQASRAPWRSLCQISRDRGHRQRGHGKIDQPRIFDQFRRCRRRVEDSNIMAAICQHPRNGHKAGGSAKIVDRQHRKQEFGHRAPEVHRTVFSARL